jgi:hypothetical protein
VPDDGEAAGGPEATASGTPPNVPQTAGAAPDTDS